MRIHPSVTYNVHLDKSGYLNK